MSEAVATKWMVDHLFGLKGRRMTAQGNALGLCCVNHKRHRLKPQVQADVRICKNSFCTNRKIPVASVAMVKMLF